MITHLSLKNFQLFENVEISFDKINVITGTNYDDMALSSNGSGKSTILNAILFAIYGDIPGLNLNDLIRIDTENTTVECQIQKGNDSIIIIRTIPSSLTIFLNGKEIQGNTLKIKQEFLDSMFGTYDEFKKYRMIDSKKGINILSLGTVSLRKTLMEFIDDMVAIKRKNLLAQKLERETYNIDKRLYKFFLSDKRLQTLETGLNTCNTDANNIRNDITNQEDVVNKLKSDIQAKEKLIYFKKCDIEKLNKGFCPILGTKCSIIESKYGSISIEKGNEIRAIETEIGNLNETLLNEIELLQHYRNLFNLISQKKTKTQTLIMKFKEAFKFSQYKYTKKDVLMYSEAIKILDEFSGYYINEWLENLAIIINDLLKNVNLKISFTPDKEFLTVTNGLHQFKYAQLSDGQQIFLNAIFKLAILLQNGKHEGTILADEGLGNLDTINLNKFIDICRNLRFTIFLVYQNINDIQNVKIISLKRENGKTVIIEKGRISC